MFYLKEFIDSSQVSNKSIVGNYVDSFIFIFIVIFCGMSDFITHKKKQ